MLQKGTFKDDAETNEFFRKHPNSYVIKFIIAGGLQHIIYTENQKLTGKVHLQRDQQRGTT